MNRLGIGPTNSPKMLNAWHYKPNYNTPCRKILQIMSENKFSKIVHTQKIKKLNISDF